MRIDEKKRLRKNIFLTQLLDYFQDSGNDNWYISINHFDDDLMGFYEVTLQIGKDRKPDSFCTVLIREDEFNESELTIQISESHTELMAGMKVSEDTLVKEWKIK